MRSLPVSRRRFAGVSVFAIVVVIAVLYLLRRIPPSTSGGGREDEPGRPAADRLRNPAQGKAREGSARPARSAAALEAEAARIIEMPEGDARLEALGVLMDTWAVVAPGAAGKWVAGLPAGDFQTDAAGELLDRWAAADGPKAWAWLSASRVMNDESIGRLAGAWAGVSGAVAAHWTGTISDPLLRSAALHATAAAWAGKEPAAAATWVETLPANDKMEAAANVVSAWPDGAAAGAWLMRLAGDDIDAIAAPAAVLAQRWTEEDAGAVSKWLNALPPGVAREATASVFASAAAPIAPDDALLWAQSLSAPEDRTETVVDVCEKWFEASPDEFRAGIEDQLKTITEPGLRKAIYTMLFEKDPAFKDTLLDLVEESQNPQPAPADVAPPPAALADPVVSEEVPLPVPAGFPQDQPPAEVAEPDPQAPEEPQEEPMEEPMEPEPGQ